MKYKYEKIEFDYNSILFEKDKDNKERFYYNQKLIPIMEFNADMIYMDDIDFKNIALNAEFLTYEMKVQNSLISGNKLNLGKTRGVKFQCSAFAEKLTISGEVKGVIAFEGCDIGSCLNLEGWKSVYFNDNAKPRVLIVDDNTKLYGDIKDIRVIRRSNFMENNNNKLYDFLYKELYQKNRV